METIMMKSKMTKIQLVFDFIDIDLVNHF